MSELMEVVNRCIILARENERVCLEVQELTDKLDERDEALQKALDRIAVLESVELLQELKEIDNGPRKE